MNFEAPDFDQILDGLKDTAEDLKYSALDTPDRIDSWMDRKIDDAKDFLDAHDDAEAKKDYIIKRELHNLNRIDDVVELGTDFAKYDLISYFAESNQGKLDKDSQIKLFKAEEENDFAITGTAGMKRDEAFNRARRWDRINSMPEAQSRNTDIVTTEVSTKAAEDWDLKTMLRANGLNKENLDYIYSFVEGPKDERAWLTAMPESTRPSQEAISKLFRDDLDALYQGGPDACATDVLSYGRSILDNENATEADLNYLVGTLQVMVNEYNPANSYDRAIIFSLTHKLRTHAVHQKNNKWRQEADRLRTEFTSKDTQPDEKV